MNDPQAPSDAPARYLIGIDLGTTNSAVAYVDSADPAWAVRDFAIPQLVGPGLSERRDTLPSFHYAATDAEAAGGAMRLPWDAADAMSRYAVGAYARDHGAALPGRLVASAKSWLSHSGVDRTAGLLPWHGAADVEKLSPVDVSARYLAHLRAAWDHAFPAHPMAAQDVVLTVPASFDEVARELTVQAARNAGLVRVVLVEEPQAAFYAWIDAQGANWDKAVRAGQTILVCDVGGGTSDFTLIRVRPAAGGKVMFHRVADGEHLILGGDNLDLALAHHVEKRLAHERGIARLEPRQWGPLVRSCRVAKETLLGNDAPARASVNVLGGGSKLIGAALQVELTREEVHVILVDGFLPRVALSDRPAARRSGFQEFGLPYASDAAITRYLAAFLSAHASDSEAVSADFAPHAGDAARPDMILFNGGLFESPALRARLVEVVTSWFAPEVRDEEQAGKRAPQTSYSPALLRNDRLDLAVARGAAYYGAVRRGHGVRITGGLAHAYFIGVDLAASADPARPAAAVCLLPAGTEEGQTVDVPGRRFDLLIRQPAEFPLYYSSTRTTDRPGALVTVDPEQLSSLPPIRTVLQSGRKGSADAVSVGLHARLTEIGTLDIWCAEIDGNRSWRLQFDVRAATRADAARHDTAGEAQGVVDENTLAACHDLIRAAFRKEAGQPPAGLVKRLEQATGVARLDWPATLMRSFWETLLEVEPGRRPSLDHESRWLNLAGFCLRPGYGLAVDDWRVAQTWRLFAGGLHFPKNELARAEWWILWRRLAGGLNAGQQAALADPLIADWRTFQRKAGVGVRGRSPTFQFGPHESAEVWRLLGSLELLRQPAKAELGTLLLERIAAEKSQAIREACLFALGRAGARVPVYGPLNALVPAETAEAWASTLMSTSSRASAASEDKVAFALVLLTRRTGDRHRDVSDATRRTVLDWMTARNAPPHLPELIREGGQLRAEEQRSAFGESLPRGLRIE